MSQCTIRPISHSEILGAANAAQLIAEYAAECLIPYAEPQREMYAAMEQLGAFQCFGAYAGDVLVGFISLVNSPMPHNGKRVGTVESLFVSAPHRASNSFNDLLTAAKQHSRKTGCLGVTYTARVGSTLEKVLTRRPGCEATHTTFTEWL